MGLGQFSDWHNNEFQSMLGLNVPETENIYSGVAAPVDKDTLPTSVNWFAADFTQPAKNQGKCGSCWVFSTVGVIEGACAIKTGTLFSLS
jgi:C1A family cysteine protease